MTMRLLSGTPAGGGGRAGQTADLAHTWSRGQDRGGDLGSLTLPGGEGRPGPRLLPIPGRTTDVKGNPPPSSRSGLWGPGVSTHLGRDHVFPVMSDQVPPHHQLQLLLGQQRQGCAQQAETQVAKGAQESPVRALGRPRGDLRCQPALA